MSHELDKLVEARLHEALAHLNTAKEIKKGFRNFEKLDLGKFLDFDLKYKYQWWMDRYDGGKDVWVESVKISLLKLKGYYSISNMAAFVYTACGTEGGSRNLHRNDGQTWTYIRFKQLFIGTLTQWLMHYHHEVLECKLTSQEWSGTLETICEQLQNIHNLK